MKQFGTNQISKQEKQFGKQFFGWKRDTAKACTTSIRFALHLMKILAFLFWFYIFTFSARFVYRLISFLEKALLEFPVGSLFRIFCWVSQNEKVILHFCHSIRATSAVAIYGERCEYRRTLEKYSRDGLRHALRFRGIARCLPSCYTHRFAAKNNLHVARKGEREDRRDCEACAFEKRRMNHRFVLGFPL